jgi:hypothetical protein
MRELFGSASIRRDHCTSLEPTPIRVVVSCVLAAFLPFPQEGHPSPGLPDPDPKKRFGVWFLPHTTQEATPFLPPDPRMNCRLGLALGRRQRLGAKMRYRVCGWSKARSGG